MEFNFNFEAFEQSGKEKNEAINYLKSLNSSIDFDKLEQENKGDENAIYEALKGGNFSFSKPSIEQTRQKLLKNKENEALKAEFNAGLSWLDNKQNFNFYDFKKAKEKANSKQGLIQADLKEKERQMQKKEALFETRLKERGIIAKSFDDMLDQSGAYLGADLLEKGLNKLGFKDENYIFESEKEDIKSRALKSVREKLERGDLEFNEREKHALRSKYDEPDYKKALEKEKERLRLSQKSGNFSEAEREFIENDLGFFNTLFNDDKENIKEFKEKVKSEGVISSEIIKAANTLKAFDEGNLFKNMLFADEKEKKEFQQNFLNDAYKIAELSGFDDVGLDKKGELYFIKDEQKYLVNTGFFDNFAQLLNDTKFEFAGGVLGGLKGFNSGKSAKGKVAKSILGAAAGSFGGAFLDAKIADMYLNRESDFKKNLDFAIQAGLLSMAGDGVILSVKPLAKGLYKGVKKGGEILGEYSILGTLKTLPQQNIQAAEKIINEVFSPKMKEELKAAQEEFGGSVRGEDLKNAFFANLQKKFTQKYGENDSKTKSVAKIAEIFNTNSLKTRQQAMLDLVRSDTHGSTLAYLLEIAKDDVKIQSNLKNMLNLASSNVEKNLKNLNINAREIKHILDEFEAGNKAAFKEVESQISKLYDENYRVVLSKGEYENIKEEFRQNGVNLEEMTPFLRDLEANVFNENGVSFTQLNNFRKNLNFYIFNKDKTPNFINTLKKIGENILKNEIDKGIDNIFSQNKAAYESIKELYSTSLKDYATLKSLNESIKNLKLQDSAKSADEVLNSLIKYAKGQGEKGVNNLQKIKDYLGEENNAFLEMQILNKLFKESVVENDRAGVRVFDSESFLGRVRELVGENELYAKNEPLKDFGENFAGYKGKEAIEKLLEEKRGQVANAFYKEGLGEIDLVWGDKNYGLEHILNKHKGEFKNLAEQLDEIITKGEVIKRKGRKNAYNIEHNGFKVGINQGFNQKGENKWIVTAFDNKVGASEKTAKTAHANDFTKETHLSLNSNESITQPLFKSKEAREFLELVEGFHKLYKNDASIAKNLVQGTASQLSTSIATSAEGAIKQKVVKGGFDPIFRLLPDGILFGLFSKQIQGGALRYHLKKALSRSLNYDDFKIKLEKELKRTNFNSNTSRLIDEFMQNLEDFNREKEQFLEAKRAEEARIKEEEQARINTIKTAQENAYNAQEANLGNDILEPSSLKENFGENFAGYKGKEAIEKLLEEKRGQVANAFYKEGLGEIDLVWGEITDLEKHKGYGLAHILDKRKSEFVEQGASQSEAAQKAAEFAKNEISNIMQNGKIINKANEATRIETQDYRLILKQNWKGEPTKNKWLVTAYMKKEKGESISSSPFTKEDNLSLNSKESIAQKALNLHEKLYLKDNDTPLNVEYKIVNKDDIKPTFTLSKTQFRSQKQEDLIKKIKENFNPDLLVNIRGDLKKGNPIITKEGEVISGNHRAAALKELEGENLAKYQNAVKEAFGVELKENEMLVRVADTSEAEIRRFSAASNEGLENNLGEQGVSLFAKYQDKIKALKEAKKPFVADDVYNLKYLVNKALGESSITKENDTSKALFASLARGRNNTILKALNELEKENLEQVSKVANMFFDNAGAFYNLTHDLDLPKMQNLQNYFSDVLVSAAKADFTRAEDFTRLNEDIRAFLDSGDKNAMLKLSPNLVSDLLAKAMGAGFARFARLENPSASLYEFLNGLKAELIEKGMPDLFSGGKGIKLNERDEFDFAKELILKGQDSEEKFRLYQNLEELKAWKSKSNLNQLTKESLDKDLNKSYTLELENLEPVSLNANALSKETEALTQSVENGHKQSTTIAKTDEESIVENGIKDDKQAFLQFIKIMQDTKNGDFYPSENLQNALEKSGKKARENALELFIKEYESKDAKLVELLKNIQEPRIASKALSLIKHFTQARMMQSAIKAVPSDILMKYVNIDASQRLEVLSSLYGDFSNIMKEVALKGKKIPDPAALSEKGGAYVFNRQYRKILNIYEKIQENEELLRLLAHKNDYKTTIEIIQESKAKGLSVKQTKEAIEENKKQTAKLFDEVIRQENKPSVKPLDEFGINFEGFKGKEAVEKLLKEANVKEEIKQIIDNGVKKGRDMQILGEENFTPEVVEYIHKNKAKVAIDKLERSEAENLGFKYSDDVRLTIDSEAIQHTLKRHGAESDLVKNSGQIPVEYKDIAEYRNIVKNADESLRARDNAGNDVIVSYRQINGYAVVVEQIRKKNNELSFKTMFKQNGDYKNSKSYKETSALNQTLSIGYEPSANSFSKTEAPQKAVNESIAENEAKKSLFESSENFYDYHKELFRKINLEGLDKQNAKDKLYANTFQTYMEKLGNFEENLSTIVHEVRPFLRLNQKDKIIGKFFRQRDKKDFKNSLKELVYLYVHKDKLGIDDIHTDTMDYAESMAKYVKGLLPYDNHLSFEKLVREKKLFDEVIRQENKPSVKPLDEFGINFEGFKGKEAVDKLLSEKRGQVKGAFYKEGLGEIDLVWGDSKKGLSHILERRKEDFIKQGLDENEALERALEFVKKIPQIIEQGEVKVGVNRAFVDTKDDRALIALDYKGKDKKWVITAYKMDDPSQADTHLTRLNTSTSSVSRASVVNESIAQNEHNAVAWDEFEAFKDKDDILKANLKGEQNDAKENEAKRQADEYESLNAIQQERGGGLFTNEELNRGQSRHARGNERDGVGVSKVDGSKSQTLFSEGDFENSRTRSGGNGGRGYTAGEENALSIRGNNSSSGEVLNADENYIRENNPRYNDTKRPREDNIIEPKRSLHMGANKTNGGANDRSILLKPQWSEALEKQGLFTSFAKAHKRSEKFTFTDTSDANKILEDNFQALEGLKYVIKSGFDNNVRSQNLQSLQNFRGFGKGTNALLKLRGEEKEKWAKLLKELTDLTGEKITITDLVKRSADAYYTPDVIIGKMANLTEFFAKEAGEDLAKLIKLEPSAGIGRFLNAFELSNFYAVEKDALSANIAKALYQKGGAIINNGAYEKSPLKINNTFDLVIGNPPYANFKIGDDEFRENIHNYFMKKNIDVLKPNGLSLQIITHNFLDAQSDYTRKVMAKDAVFLGAVRLANNVFKDASVTTDIIAFRKKAPDEMDKEFNTSWVESVEYEGAYLNKYFLENPQNVIGKMEVVKNQFGGKTIAVKPNGFDIENLNLSNYIKNDKLFKRVEGYIDNKLLSKAVQRIEEKEKGVSFFGSARSGELRFDKESDKFLVLDDQQNTHDFNIYERISEAKPNWQESSINNRVEALKEMMPQIEKLKKALFDLKEAELNPNSSDEKIEILRRILNKAYDELHGKNGSFRNARGKISQKWELYDILDDTSFELFALEKKAIVEERGDKKIVIGSEKSEIFHKRLVKPYEAPTSANNINEALQISKAEYGKIDLVRMSELLSKDMSEVENELLEQKRIYKDHLGGNVEKDEFLSGNVREKIARFYDENGSLNLSSDEKIRAFQMQSLEDLKAIVPDDIELPFINIPLGATWLDKEILREFFAKELEIGEVNFKRAGNRWYLLGKFNGSLEITTSEDYLRDTGIKAINAVDYILKMMNNESLEVKTSKTKADGSIKHYKDPIATQKLQDLKIKLEKQLKNFIMDNEEYAEQTKRVYNDVFNSEVIRKYDGSHIRLMETNEDISLRSHQNNAVYRFLQKSNTLLAHDVGTGKTYTMIASAMLSKQLGLAKKSLIVTPNNVSPQMAREARELFPNARIKLIQGVSTKEKNRLMADVKNNEYDLIIVSYDTFKVMNANPKLYADYLNEELIQLRYAIEALENSDEGDERIMKQLAKRLESEEAKLEHYLEQVANGSQNVFFEDLGIDNLIFDEAHYLKKLPIFTKQGNVRGIQRGKSQRALDAYIKIKHHQSLNKKVMFATGTPITNFVSDIYVMQKFLGRKALEDSNISEFDDWSAMFAGSQTQFELKASGNYEATTRLRNFANLPELKKMYYEFTDVVTKDDVKKQIVESTGEQIEPTPVYEEVIIKQSEAQKAFYEEIKERAVNLKGKKIEKGGDNHLKILSDANKASLDMRLIYPHLERDANGKVMQAAEKIVENYHLWDADKGTQLVFLDKSTPKKSITSAKRAKLENKLSAIKEKLEKYENDDINLSEEALEKLEKEKVEIEEILEMAGEGFSVYEDLRKLLIEKGIKPEEIAFVQDYDKAGTGALSQADLSEKINNGKIRVLIGSTAKMGAGANYQRKLSALHHLDLDWTPANMEQREGRIIRQGNELFKKYGDEFKAKIYYYVTEQTSDTVMLQTLNQKRKIIKQITDINEKARFLEDSSEDDFMARLQAATSPYAEEELRFLGIDKEISLLNSELENSAYVIKSAEREILKQNEAVEGFEAIKSLLPSILKKAENNISFKTKEGKIIDFNAKPKKDEASPHEKLNMSVKKSIESLFNSSEKLMQIGEYRGSKLFALKAGNAKCVIKMGENLQNSLYFTELDYMDIKGAFSANLRFKNAFEKISKNSYFTDLEQKIKDAKEAQKRALKKLENEKARDLSEINKTLNDALVEKAELAIFLGRAEQEHKSLVSAVHNVPDIKENEEDKFTKLEEFIMAKYNKN
ncbi:DEAD/DEAH box helicase family protein [Campylobacter upsaliensis]|nr:DEAD/DEAH box helicase family protein [Campylobacter upsaliensis]